MSLIVTKLVNTMLLIETDQCRADCPAYYTVTAVPERAHRSGDEVQIGVECLLEYFRIGACELDRDDAIEMIGRRRVEEAEDDAGCIALETLAADMAAFLKVLQ